MPEHTPGPWKAREYQEESTGEYHVGVDTDYPPGLDNGSRSIISCTGGAYLQPKGKMAEYFKPELLAENRANARLIAAAPDMFEALTSLYEHCAMIHKKWGDGCNSIEADKAIEAGIAAIAKATEEGK